jgi:hypothetical protein
LTVATASMPCRFQIGRIIEAAWISKHRWDSRILARSRDPISLKTRAVGRTPGQPDNERATRRPPRRTGTTTIIRPGDIGPVQSRVRCTIETIRARVRGLPPGCPSTVRNQYRMPHSRQPNEAVADMAAMPRFGF